MKTDFYVYVIFRPNGIPCYVGKGRGDRMQAHKRRKGNLHLAAIYAMNGGALPAVKVRCDLSESEAFETECALIAALGREPHGGVLVNLTDGGEGTAGWTPGPGWVAKRKESAAAMWQDPVMRQRFCRAKLGNSNSKGQVHSDEWKAANAERMRGNQNTKGMKFPPEVGAKGAARWADPTYRTRMMDSRRASGMYEPEAVARRIAKRTENYQRRKVIG